MLIFSNRHGELAVIKINSISSDECIFSCDSEDSKNILKRRKTVKALRIESESEISDSLYYKKENRKSKFIYFIKLII